jgi:hypothetical protein
MMDAGTQEAKQHHRPPALNTFMYGREREKGILYR